MNGLAVFFLAGMTVVYHWASLPTPAALCALLAILCIGLWRRHWRIVALLAGVLWVSLTQEPARIPDVIAGQAGSAALTVVGQIDSIPKVSGGKTVFQLTVRDVAGEAMVPFRIRLAWYDDAPALSPGQLWRLNVRLKPARGRFNRVGFDYERWLFQKRIVARGYVADAETATLLRPSPDNLLTRLRNAFRAHLDDLLPVSAPGVMKAVLAGDKTALDSQLAGLFRDTGTAHVLVISGLHITLSATLGYGLGLALWRVFRLRQFNRLRFAIGVGFAVATVYAMLAGFTLPVTRAWVMLAVWVGCGLLRRHLTAMSKWQLALMAVLVIDPRAPLDAGFWLSFYAVAVIILMLPLDRFLPPWLLLVPWQWRMTLLTLPMMVLVFQQFSPVSLIANLLILPVFSFLLVPAGFIAALLGGLHASAGSWVLAELVAVVDGVALLLDALLALPGALWIAPGVGIGAAISGFIGAALVLFPAQLRWRLLAPVFFLGLFLPRAGVPDAGQAEITVLDVGQGLSVLVRTRHHSLVYDTGAWLSRDLSVARGLIVPLLYDRGLRGVDALLVSHPDSDHAAGYDDLLTDISIGQVIANPRFDDEFGRIDLPCEHGHEWHWDGVYFRLLLADLDEQGSENDASCVLEVTAKGERLLLTGDIETRAEQALIATNALRPARYLVAPHHGSRSSSTAAFIEAVAPRHVIYTVGYRNRWRFPAPEVVARYDAAGVRHWRTDRDGCIDLTLGKRDLTAIRACRDVHVQFWRPPFDL